MPMRYNIPALYLIKFSKWFMLTMPIAVLFYNSNGLNQFQVMVLQAIYSVSIVALEIPSGYYADVLGRKKTLLVGSVLGFIGYMVYSVSSGFYGFMMAEIILGFGTSFISGADSALLYETLMEQKRENQYSKYEGRVVSMGNFAEAFAALAGGALAVYSLRTPYYFQTFISFLAIPASLILIEPIRQAGFVKPRFSDIWRICTNSLYHNKPLMVNIMYSSLIGASTLTMAWFVQPFFERISIPLEWFGPLWTILNLSVGLFALYAWRIDKILPQKNSVPGITVILSLCYILVGLFNSWIGLCFVFIFYFVRGIATPLLRDYINRLTSNDVRATVLSIRNFVIRLIFAIIGPLVGALTDNYSLALALSMAGLFFLLSGMYFYFLYLKYSKS